MGVTIKELATEAGLSWPAVSQILTQKGRFAEATRKRVLELAERRGYRPNSAARALRQQESKFIGVVYRNAPDQPLTNMVAFEYLLGMNQRFQTADYCTVMIRAAELLDEGQIEPRVFRERMVDGVIVVGSLPDSVLQRVATLAPKTIFLDTANWTEHNCIRRDEELAGRLATEAMIDLGYRRITFIARDPLNANHHSLVSREAGSRKAAEAAGVKFSVVSWPESDTACEQQAIVETLKPAVGIVVSSLVIARRIAHNAGSLRLCAGHHFGMVCCDDSFDTFIGWRGLSRVEFDRYGMGVRASEMMLSLVADAANPPASVLVPDRFVAGNTAWGPLSPSQ